MTGKRVRQLDQRENEHQIEEQLGEGDLVVLPLATLAHPVGPIP